MGSPKGSHTHNQPSKALKRGCAIVVVLVLAVGLSAGLWLQRRLSLRPNIARNYTAEYNARLENIPESDRAWPIYRDYMVQYATLSDTQETSYVRWMELNGARPGDPAWDEAVTVFADLQPTLDLSIKAAAKPHVGYVMSDAHDSAYLAAIGEPAELPSDNPRMIDILLTHLGAARKLSQYLMFDARLALHEDDVDRFVQRMSDMAQLAEHSRESETLISQLVGYAILGLTYREIQWAVQTSSETLTEAHLDALDTVLDTIEQAELTSLTYKSERTFMDDTIQRTYSDDGKGDGVMTLRGAKELDEILGSTGQLWSVFSASPVRVFGLASRKEMTRFLDEFYAAAQSSANSPPFADVFGTDDIRTKYMPNERAERRYAVVDSLIPAVYQVAQTRWQTQTLHTATRTRIAIERYTRAHGDAPSTLDALVPEYLDQIPHDIYVDAPLGWKQTEFGWTLYSVWRDEIDDGGTPALEDGSPLNRPIDKQGADWILFPIFHTPVTGEDEDW